MNELLNEIGNFRRANNSPWMRLLDLALTHAPDLAKPLIREIAENDRQVWERFRRLADE